MGFDLLGGDHFGIVPPEAIQDDRKPRMVLNNERGEQLQAWAMGAEGPTPPPYSQVFRVNRTITGGENFGDGLNGVHGAPLIYDGSVGPLVQIKAMGGRSDGLVLRCDMSDQGRSAYGSSEENVVSTWWKPVREGDAWRFTNYYFWIDNDPKHEKKWYPGIRGILGYNRHNTGNPWRNYGWADILPGNNRTWLVTDES
ncbi:hypothetical protein ACWEV4_32380 [Streptomyces sp. NPDC003860]